MIEYLTTQAAITPESVVHDPDTWTCYVDGDETTRARLGEQGWEQCDRYPEPEGGGLVTVVFKRPVGEGIDPCPHNAPEGCGLGRVRCPICGAVQDPGAETDKSP